MPIQSIILQPAADSLQAAYRPIVFQTRAFATGSDATAPVLPPVVYCDIYFLTGYQMRIHGFDGTANYYRTLTKTYALSSSSQTFEFDIQDACQEVLSCEIPPYGINELFKPRFAFHQVQCKFRSSGIDGGGFTTYEDIAPIQPTNESNEGGGTGTPANTFYVLNTTLRHEENQNLSQHLSFYRKGTWKANHYPLTHRPNKYILGAKDNEFFPFFYPQNTELQTIELNYRYNNQSTFHSLQNDIPSVWGDPDTAVSGFVFESPLMGGLLHLPCGPINLTRPFPSINFSDVAEYSVRLLDPAGAIAIETPMHTIQQYDERFRIRFFNYLATTDAVNFVLAAAIHDTKSDQTQKPTAYPLDKSEHSLSRFNVRSNDTWTVKCAAYDETAQDWLDELMDSPKAWMEVEGIENQLAYYLPIIITDQKKEKRKEEDRYVYELTLEFKLSHERIIIRN